MRRGQHAPTRRLLLRRELRRRCDLAAERNEARDHVLGKGRHFHFPHHRLLDERRKLFLLALDPCFLAHIKFGQHFACEQLERLADMIVPVLTALLDKGDLIDARILKALEM